MEHLTSPHRWSFTVVALTIAATVSATGIAAPAAASQEGGVASGDAWSAATVSARVQAQVDVILSQQRPSGAIQHGSGGINVYFGNFAALGLLAEGSPDSVDAAIDWHDWVLDRLNREPDAQGVRFTSYDYAIRSGQEVSSGRYDSIDSYAATTLSVAEELSRSGDPDASSLVASHADDYLGIAGLLVASVPSGVLKKSGLTQATATYNIGYVMDNTEVYEGLLDAASLFGGLGLAADAARFATAAAASRAAILNVLWNAAAGTWNVYDRSAAALDGAFYPAGMAQYFPLIHGVVAPDDPRSLQSWGQLTTRWPGWAQNTLNRAEAATPMAYAAVLLGHDSGARSMLDDIAARYAPGWRYPTTCDAPTCQWWSPSQAGWYIRTLLALGSAP